MSDKLPERFIPNGPLVTATTVYKIQDGRTFSTLGEANRHAEAALLSGEYEFFKECVGRAENTKLPQSYGILEYLNKRKTFLKGFLAHLEAKERTPPLS